MMKSTLCTLAQRCYMDCRLALWHFALISHSWLFRTLDDARAPISKIKIHHYQLTRWDLYVIIFFLSHIQPIAAFADCCCAGTWQRCGLNMTVPIKSDYLIETAAPLRANKKNWPHLRAIEISLAPNRPRWLWKCMKSPDDRHTKKNKFIWLAVK